MEIVTQLKPACERCPRFCPEVESTDLYADNSVQGRILTISCQHRENCDAIEQYLTGAMKKPENCVPNFEHSFDAPAATFACMPDSHILENEMVKTLGKEKDIDIPPFCSKSFMTHQKRRRVRHDDYGS